MQFVDLSQSQRIPFQMEILTANSRLRNPASVLQLFIEALRRVYGRRRYLVLSTHELTPGDYSIGLHLNEDGEDLVKAADPWRGEGLAVRRGGLLGRIVQSASPKLVHHLDAGDDLVLGPALAGCGSLMAVPIFENGTAHNWLVVTDGGAEGCRVADLEELNLRANLVGSMINHVRIAKQLNDANHYIQREVERIASIQRALLPDGLPDIPGLRMAASYQTFDRAGGDLYDVRPVRRPPACGDGEALWAMLIADASGHGPSAAVVTAMLDATLRAYRDDPGSPGDMLAYANRHLCTKRIHDSFVTAFFGFYNPSARTLTYACAGHNPPLVGLPERGTSRYLDEVGGLPLGIDDDVVFENATVQLQPGQTLLMYTDGVCEAMSPRGEMLGACGVERLVANCRGGPDALVRDVLAALKDHECGRRACDDQTLLAIQPV